MDLAFVEQVRKVYRLRHSKEDGCRSSILLETRFSLEDAGNAVHLQSLPIASVHTHLVRRGRNRAMQIKLLRTDPIFFVSRYHVPDVLGQAYGTLNRLEIEDARLSDGL